MLQLNSCATSPKPAPLADWQKPYPAHWWAPVDRTHAPAWEVFPDEVGVGEVILSKRNELGLLSNFSATPFKFHGKNYASLEGFWQSLLYPESDDDLRAKLALVHHRKFPHTRDEVAGMVAFDAKLAGDEAEKILKAIKIDWVTFEGRRMLYWDLHEGPHFHLIEEVTRAKVEQSPKVKEVLLATGNLKLRPDHHQEPGAPPAWHYFDLYMKIRSELQSKK